MSESGGPFSGAMPIEKWNPPATSSRIGTLFRIGMQTRLASVTDRRPVAQRFDSRKATMIDHISSYTTQFVEARAFYDAALRSLGHSIQVEMVADWDPDFPERRCCAWGPPGRSVFWVIEVREAASPRHIAFSAADRGQVDAFYRSAMGAGGRDHGEPGVRAVYHADYYGAFVLDPDDNNVEAVCHSPGGGPGE